MVALKELGGGGWLPTGMLPLHFLWIGTFIILKLQSFFYLRRDDKKYRYLIQEYIPVQTSDRYLPNDTDDR